MEIFNLRVSKRGESLVFVIILGNKDCFIMV